LLGPSISASASTTQAIRRSFVVRELWRDVSVSGAASSTIPSASIERATSSASLGRWALSLASIRSTSLSTDGGIPCRIWLGGGACSNRTLVSTASG
jgi:hypothetical protein